MKNNFFVKRLESDLSQTLWDEVGEFINRQKFKDKIRPYKDQILSPSETKDFELIFLVSQAMKFRKKTFEQYLHLLPIYLKGFKDKSSGETFLLDEIPPIKYTRDSEYNKT
mmetsp:Transcript_20142/g.19780  ORF Transcript_20142/g.19780 Transcript_20142/m.19780 type:complete len:111 (-) Transcript_20142:73-405(-)